MKLLFTAKGDDWGSQLDPNFGRATGFLLYDTTNNEKFWISNQENIQASHGAGIQAAQKAADLGVKILITGKVGPKAKSTLDNTGIQIFTVDTLCTLEEAYTRFMDSNK
jgi:predicted Fe-Mo cluster-binding NifX family protein